MKIKVKGLVFAGLAATIFAGNAMATADTVVTSKAYVDQKLGLKANTADLATVATTGNYNDLSNKPTIPAAQVNADWNATEGVAQILNKPTIPTAVSDLTNDTGFITSAQVPAQVNANWNATEGVAQILNKPTLAPVATSGNASDLTQDATHRLVTDTEKSTWSGKQDAISDLSTIRSGAAAGATAVQPGDLATVATTGDYDDLTNKPTIPAAQVQSDWNATSGMGEILNKPSLSTVATTGNYSDLSGTPNLATVATSGSYNDLSNKPTIPAAQVQSDWNATSGMGEILNKPSLSTVATTGNYSDLSGTPSLSNVATSGAYSDLSGTPDLSGYQLIDNKVTGAVATWTEATKDTKYPTIGAIKYTQNANCDNDHPCAWVNNQWVRIAQADD